MTINDLFTDTGAIFSPCKTWRYRLWRVWDRGRPIMVWIMLNPSTADAEKNDPTVAKITKLARRLGYGGIEVLNLFAIRSPYPKILYDAADPVGVENDRHILAACRAGSPMVVCGWGAHGGLMNRDFEVMDILDRVGIEPHCIRVTKDGHPGHPLYVPGNQDPFPYHRRTLDA